MNTTRQTYRPYLLRILVSRSILGILALTLVGMANFSFAQSAAQFGIGESARLLEAALDLERGEISPAEYHSIKVAETCKDPATRLQNRNRPWMYVYNTSTVADDVTSVTVDLTEQGFEFGDGDVAGDGFDGLLSMLSYRSDAGVSLDSATYGNDNTELVLNFSGLSQDLAAIFRIDLDEPGGPTMYPDFREAMLGADTGMGPGQLAIMTAGFTSGNMISATFPMADPLPTSGIAEGYHSQTMSMVETSIPVPEPTALVLLLVGLTSIASTRRYR